MRHGTSSRRQRGRGNGGRRGNQQRMQVYDSNGPDVRIRGTAHQVHEKYAALAKDAASSGDIILSQSYLQHAEHYQRIINELQKDVQDKKDSSKSQRGGQDNAAESNKKPQAADDDLALPASILGESPKVSSAESAEERTVDAPTS